MAESTPTFEECLLAAGANTELVTQFDRLYRTSLSKLTVRSPLDLMIDEATGYDKDQILKFAAFVFSYIWLPLQVAT